MSVFLNKHIILFRVDTQRHMQAQTESRILITLGTHKHVYRLGKITLFCSIILLEITLGCTHVCEVGSCTVSDSDTPAESRGFNQNNNILDTRLDDLNTILDHLNDEIFPLF